MPQEFEKMRATRRVTVEEDNNGAVPEETQVLQEMVKSMRKQNEERRRNLGEPKRSLEEKAPNLERCWNNR